MILIYICCFVRLFNKNVFLRTTLDLLVILDGQFSSLTLRNKIIDYRIQQTEDEIPELA
jgi:hypothetical protein